MMAEIQNELYDQLFKLMFEGESVEKVPLFKSKGHNRYAPFQRPYFQSVRPISNTALDPWIEIDKKLFETKAKPFNFLYKNPKELIYAMSHELGHAKDFSDISKKMTPREFRKLWTSRSGIIDKLGAETRGAKIHMPFLREHFGKNALSEFRKKDFLLKEQLGTYGDKISKKDLLKEIKRFHGPSHSSRFLSQVLGSESSMLTNMGVKYKNLAGIARSAGLMGLLMAIMIPMMSGEKKSA